MGWGSGAGRGGRGQRATSCLESSIRVREAEVEIERGRERGGGECMERRRGWSLNGGGTRSPPMDSFRSAILMTPGAYGTPRVLARKQVYAGERARSESRRARWR